MAARDNTAAARDLSVLPFSVVVQTAVRVFSVTTPLCAAPLSVLVHVAESVRMNALVLKTTEVLVHVAATVLYRLLSTTGVEVHVETRVLTNVLCETIDAAVVQVATSVLGYTVPPAGM